MPLAPMLAAALAVNEAFLFARQETPAAGRRMLGLSLWRPDPLSDWLVREENEPALRFLPSRLWLIGLGHLGQAYLWALGLLPYPKPSGLELVLQDVDVITPSTESTSILSNANLVGQKKTRAMAAWAENRGFEGPSTSVFSAHHSPDRIESLPWRSVVWIMPSVARLWIRLVSNLSLRPGLAKAIEFRVFAYYIARSPLCCGNMEGGSFSRRCWGPSCLPKNAE